ncbi:DUF192 domain-containing protein [Dyadobacter tibetensis]|uniref:DUF192 domain-containing protein n=1 Tax=Dyadobacter tibetensis TaxID=1211851 RepID=UPI0004711FE6|nr:DUF192 domain-containing protein [Dyadobacter tibetensis]
MRNRPVIFARILLLIVVLAGLAYIAVPFINPSFHNDSARLPHAESAASGPTFKKQGDLWFLKNGQKLKRIDIEFAATAEARNLGLMYRTSLPDSAGMLFVYEEAAPRVFWMKNTYIPLDIIYVGANKKIVSISKNTSPHSEENIASEAAAQFVVEVNAGFTTNHQIEVGDVISF